ncbi:MAG: autotransporter [Solirubrobacteraceae bacterium]
MSAVLLMVLAPQALAGTALPATIHDTERSRPADTARTLNVTDTAHLRYISHTGALLYEEGAASGTLPGSMRAHCNISSTVTANFTIYTHGGTITGHGTATPHGAGIYESFAGSFQVTGGTGNYAHAHGHAGLSGTFDRRTYALTVQTTGRLSY